MPTLILWHRLLYQLVYMYKLTWILYPHETVILWCIYNSGLNNVNIILLLVLKASFLHLHISRSMLSIRY